MSASLMTGLMMSFLLGAGTQGDPPPAGTAALGETAPDFSLRTAEGFVRRSEGLAGPNGLVIIFATHETASDVIALQDSLAKIQKTGLNALVVDIDCFAAPKKAEAFWAVEGAVIPVLYDDGAVARLFGVEWVPYAVFIAENGTVRYLGETGTTVKERHRVIRYFNALANDDESVARPQFTPRPAEHSFLPNCRGVGR